MNEAIQDMLARYACRTREDHLHALREILQELALLGLWRSKFFEHAAFYGGTALRVLHGLDRYSEDLDFSLLRPDPEFALAKYGEALRRELASFGFEVAFEPRSRRAHTPIESAFLKGDTLRQMVAISAPDGLIRGIHPGELLRIKIEVDTDPPPMFETESRYLLQPIPFTARVYQLPDLFAGKMHAILCRNWKNRVKGRDWYDLVWYVARHPQLRIRHLESRLRQSGHFDKKSPLNRDGLAGMLDAAIDRLDVRQAAQEVAPFIRNRHSLDAWSPDFFHHLVGRIIVI